MPTNSAVREMLPPKRLICATRYSRSNTSRASRSGSPIRCSPPLPFGMLGTIEPTSGGSMLALSTASGIAAGQNHQPLDIVAQLAHVARPVVRLQHRHGVLADAPLGQAGRLRNLVHEIVDQVGDVLAPLGQRRHADRHHRQAVIEVLAEFSVGDLRFEIARGRGDDAHVDRDLGAAADALEGLIDQHAQDLVLRLARHIGDVVDEQRAAMRLFQRAELAPVRAVGLIDAEQFDFHALRRDRGGIDDDEGTAGARRQLDGWCARRAPCRSRTGPTMRMRLLVGATLSMVWRNCSIAARVPDQRRRQRRQLLELLDLALEPRGLQRAVGDQHQPVGLERLLDEIVGAALDGGDRGFDVAVAGDHHHRQLRDAPA